MDSLPPHAQEGNPYTIYALIDPRDYSVRYIGITDDVYARFAQHLRSDGENLGKEAWIAELKAENVMLIMKTLEVVDGVERAREREAFWIQHHRFLKAPLLNLIIPSIRLPKRLVQPRLFKDYNSNGRKHNDSHVKEIIVYRHMHGQWPDGVSEDMKSYYKWFYFTIPHPNERTFKNRTYKQHVRAYSRGQSWIAEVEQEQTVPEGKTNAQ